MTDPAPAQKPDRPALPRDAFRSHRLNTLGPEPIPSKPVVVTPSYEDPVAPASQLPGAPSAVSRVTRKASRPSQDRNPFEAYGERSSSRPYALRLPDAIDFVVRQIAAEERTQPLRIIDRILYDHLKRIGRLPPPRPLLDSNGGRKADDS